MGDGLPIRGPGTPPAPVVRRVQTIDLQPSADAIRSAKLNQPVTGAAAKARSSPAVTPDDLRAAKSTGGVVIPKVKSIPTRGVGDAVPAENRMVDGRGIPSGVPAPSSKRIGGNVRAAMAEGVAQAFHNFMERGMHRSAHAAAERAASSKWLLDKVFKARQDGAWVLVTAYFAESVAQNVGGARHLVFHNVGYAAVYAAPGEDPGRTLARLHATRTLQSYDQSWHTSQGERRSGRFSADDWRIVPLEMRVYAGESTEDVVSEPDPTGIGVGRCTVRKLR
jgi:hypothetical protein